MTQQSITVKEISAAAELEQAFAVRYEVFVQGQGAPAALEVEGNESAVHFLALLEGRPAGAGRYRQTDKGFKLERIAVLEACRGRGVGDALVKAMLAGLRGKGTIYLHSQLAAAGLYARNGFVQEGQQFTEADMQHIKMVYAG
ncbi:GNAT family N-acetyltransferase [Taibaiella chishuiensis]|uniref:Putative GNAT family N-acyltransferase n=1 Tax=Taibaiella chishuiensis TaxID=1434707 RepID=A0A2P8D4L7_9BACT|nr:GNAT family N-acetyltransferase [Taibaiella chishuiensis]PSK92119.1 putative GNAT family N-acyltransferase [Taibaiella chishuiensis]